MIKENYKKISFETLGKLTDSIYNNTVLEVEKALGKHIQKLFDLKIDLSNIDLSFFYVQNGHRKTKITNVIKNLIKPHVNKKFLDIQYPLLGHKIAQHYEPIEQYQAYFANFTDIDRGINGDKNSCFRSSGEKNFEGKFLQANQHRFKYLCLESAGRGKARCIAYLQDSQTVWITNFHYNGIESNESLFVIALRLLLELKKVKYGDGDTEFPFYCNQDQKKVWTPEIIDPELDKPLRYVCPNCGNNDKAENFYGSGCSRDCTTELENAFYCRCSRCEIGLSDNEYYYTEDEVYFCETCNDNYNCLDCNYTTDNCNCQHCESCLDRIPDGDSTEIDGEYYCQYCVTTCRDCQDDIVTDNSTEIDGEYYCQDCEPEPEPELEKIKVKGMVKK